MERRCRAREAIGVDRAKRPVTMFASLNMVELKTKMS